MCREGGTMLNSLQMKATTSSYSRLPVKSLTSSWNFRTSFILKNELNI